MSLESNQSLHNSFIANAGNISASNDPTQKPHDANELLIRGASAAAAGRELGLSEEETLAAVSRQYRRQRRADDRVTKEDVLRQFNQAAATVRSEVGGAELKGVNYQDDDEITAVFGQTDYEAGFRDLDKDNGVDNSPYGDEVRGVRRSRTRETEDLLNPVREQESPFYNPEVAPKSVLQDALGQLEGAKQENKGLVNRIASVFGGGNAVNTEINTAEDALRRHIQAEGPQDARIGRAMVRQDNQRFNPEMREYNDNRAAATAEGIAREYFGGTGLGNMADDAIGRIAEVRSLGKIGETAHVVRTANDAIKGQAARRHDGVFLDPVTNDPIAVQGPDLPPVLAGDRTPSNGSSSDALNAPQTAVSWVAESMPDYREGGRTFGDFPQTDITLQTTNFANRVRDYGKRAGLQQLTTVSPNIRSIGELQNVVSYIASESEKRGRGLTIPDPENPGRALPAGNRTVSGVMQAIGMTAGEQQQFANAMFQLDAARRSSVNENPTGTYLSRSTKQGPQLMGQSDIVFDAPEAINPSEGQAKVARIPKGARIRTGVNESGKPVRTSIVKQLSQLQGTGAQKPFIGQVEGEKPRVNRYNRTGETEPERIDAKLRSGFEGRARRDRKPVDEAALRSQQTKAKLVQERENRDSRKREEQRKLIQAHTPANLRQVGRYDEADKDISGIERRIKEQQDARAEAKAKELNFDLRGRRR